VHLLLGLVTIATLARRLRGPKRFP
jgi:hypothetical protein